MSQDYYSILGVNKNASDDEIKSAYRKLAMKYHPDRNQGNADAEEKFKEVNEAYQTLGDKDKRKQYDMMGHSAFTSGGRGNAGPNVDPMDMFKQAFGGRNPFSGFDMFDGMFGGFGRMHHTERNSNRPQRGSDILQKVTIDFKDAYFGTTKTINIRRSVNCDHCHGSGCEPGSTRRTCPECHGNGMVQEQHGFMCIQHTCARCNGTGEVNSNPCKHCNGSGLVSKPATLEIKIPAGIDSGNRLRVEGQGNSGKNGGPCGDLFVEVIVNEDNIFKRDGIDIFCTVPITMFQAILGGKVSIPTPTGMTEVEIAPGTQTGTTIVIVGKGFPKINGSSKGKLTITILVEIPTKLNEEQINKFRDISSCTNSSNYAIQGAFNIRSSKWS